MPAYIVVNETVTDPETFMKYAGAAGQTIVQYGGKILAAGPDSEILEGEPGPVVVVIEFSSIEQAKSWYNSSEYQAIIGLRLASSSGWMVLAPEFVPPGG